MSDVSSVIEKAVAEYRQRMAAVKADANYGLKAGNVCHEILEDCNVDNLDDLKQVMQALFRENQKNVASATAGMIQEMNAGAGIGLKASEAAADLSSVQKIADAVSAYEQIRDGIKAAKNDVVLQSSLAADRTLMQNANFQSGAGMRVLVSREYDGVGVHTTDKGGGEACQWCLDRCGADVPYREAYAHGMFERHPGCGCVITYKSEKGTFTQGKGDWEANAWDEEDGRLREKRINFSYLQQHKKGDKVMITEQAIQKVAKVSPNTCSSEQANKIQEMHKEILRISREQNMSNEVAMIIGSGGKVSAPVLGEKNNVNVTGDPEIYHALRSSDFRSITLAHNHPGLSYFSYEDIGIFVQYPSIQTMTVVSNQGKVWYISKKEKYDDEKVLELYLKTGEKMSGEKNTDVVEKFLKSAYNMIERGKR